MPVYSVEGKLGTGKTKFCVWRAQEALRQGRRVASNVDLYCHHLVPEKRVTFVRIPDKPSAEDLDAIGHGNPGSYDEDRNGVLILDELGTWLNTRSFQDKSRASMIDWLIHARKKGWDVYLIVQDAGMIDKQVREALIEYQCRCMRMDKVRIPLVGKLLGLLGGRWGMLPRMHLTTARVGYGANAIVAERWMYRGDDLHTAYDTRQTFTSNYPHGPHSFLPPWDWQPPPEHILWRTLRAVSGALHAQRAGHRAPPLRPKLRIVELIQHLPADERIRHIARLEAQRLLDRLTSVQGTP